MEKEEDSEEEEEFKGKTLEEKLAILELSDISDLERINKTRGKSIRLSDENWKILVGLIGTGIDFGLVLITLQMIEALLSGSFS